MSSKTCEGEQWPNNRCVQASKTLQGSTGLNRDLSVYVDASTWPLLGVPAFPPTFPTGSSVYSLHIPSMLLMIGYLTTPTAATGVSLSEFWAWVRYLAAVTSGADLRLTASFAGLDAHQKTILSDDFGMGVPMVWLGQHLALQDICDGRYFVDRIAAGLGATALRSSRRGPNKTPDFVARDLSGVWHIVECKGTQSGGAYLDAQMGNAGPPPLRGVAQKRSIVFPPGHTGQRLVSGLHVAADGMAGSSRLVIIDPEPENPFEIEEFALEFAEDAAARAVVARALRLAGFEATADTTASPLGSRPSDRPSRSSRFEEIRQRSVEERSTRAREELSDLNLRRAVSADGRFRGRVLEFDLPRSIEVDGRRVSRASVRQGVNHEVLGELAARPTVDELLPSAKVEWGSARGQTTVKGDGGYAELRIGDLFMAEIHLE